MQEVCVLITSTGGQLGYQLINSLKNSHRYIFFVIAVDTLPWCAAAEIADEFYQVSTGDCSSYPEEIMKIVSQRKVDLIFPGSDEEALSLAKFKKDFSSCGATIACNDIEISRILSNKVLTFKVLEEHGIPLPEWSFATEEGELRDCVNQLLSVSGTVTVKVPDGRGSRGIYIVKQGTSGAQNYNSTREVHSDFTTFNNTIIPSLNFDKGIMVMETLKEPVHDLDILCWQGTIKHAVARRRVNSARPNDGHIIVDNSEMVRFGERVVKALGLSWLFDIDFMINKDGSPGLLEINPRASGSVSVAIAAGVPLFDDMISLHFGEEVAKCRVPVGKFVYPYTVLGNTDPKSLTDL